MEDSDDDRGSTTLYICCLCDNIFIAPPGEVSPGSEQNPLCSTCPREYRVVVSKPSSVRKHSKRCRCDECHRCFDQKRFDDVSCRNAHINSLHSSEISSQCLFHNQVSKTTQSLSLHMHKCQCVKSQGLMCQECTESFQSDKELQEHVLLVHHMPHQFQCSVCSRGFPTYGECASHHNLLHNPVISTAAEQHNTKSFLWKCVYRFKYMWGDQYSFRRR